MAADLEQRLATWVEEGLISHAQASAIWTHEQSVEGVSTPTSVPPASVEGVSTPVEGVSAAASRTAQSGGRSSVVAEAIGYVGAVLTLVAAGLVLGDFWDQITPWGRLLLTGLLTLAVFLAGWVLRDRPQPAIRRLTSVLWFTTSVGVAVVVGLAVEEGGGEDRYLGLGIALAVTAVSAVLHRWRQTALQLLALSLGVAAVAMTALAVPDADVDPMAYGLLLWALGVAWVLLAGGGWLRPSTTAQVLGLLAIGIGCQVMTFGSYTEAGVVLALVSSAVLLWVSVVAGSTVILSFAVIGLFVFVPQAVFTFFGDSIGAPLALLLTGLLLVAASVGLVTLRREITDDEPVAAAP